MGNGRSFTRNRKGSPGKSRRKAEQRYNAQQAAQRQVKDAVDSVVAATSDALESVIKKAAESLVAASGNTIPQEEAEDMLTNAHNAYAREADG